MQLSSLCRVLNPPGSQAEWPRAIAELTSYPHIEEAAVLSTCNRMELYVVALSRNRVSIAGPGWASIGSGGSILTLSPHSCS